MARSWWKYWRKIGHVPKKRADNQLSIDSAHLYDTCNHLLNDGEKAFKHGCVIQFYSGCATITPPNGDPNSRYTIPVVITRCNYGGVRHWFLCTNPECRRRSKKLYLNRQGIFFCRKCLRLAYISQNRSRLDRIIDKKWALIRKLGGSSDFIAHKPKRMHQKTFDRMQEEILRLNELAEQGIFERFCNPFNLH
jgi:hypothetical protein